MSISRKKRAHITQVHMGEEVMELSEACDKLAELIVQERKSVLQPGYLIQFFVDGIEQGETPAMALALAKKEAAYIDDEGVDVP